AVGDGLADRQWFGVDNSGGVNDGSLYCSYVFTPGTNTSLPGQNQVVRVLRPGNTAFEPTQTEVDANATATQFANVGVDGNGNVHVSYARLNGLGDPTGIWHAASFDGGTTFQPAVKIANCSFPFSQQNPTTHRRENPAVNMAIDTSNNILYVVWASQDLGENTAYLSRSTDDGATWSSPFDLTTLSPGANRQGLFASVGVNEHGHISVSWFDLSSDGATGIWVTSESFDNGLTFDPAEYVSSASTPFGTYPATHFFGDYTTTARYGCRSFSAWTDGRNGQGPKIYVARVEQCSANPVGLPELSPLTSDLHLEGIHPNPVADQLRFTMGLAAASTAEIRLLNMEGKAVLKLFQGDLEAGTRDYAFAVDGLAAGVYMLYVETELGVVSRKIVKE
ncbi:MAG: T9SS type A sorting domain-containing protein, partial [Bacteroidota bacterium]